MTAQITRWFEYGQPVEDARVEATIRTTYQTGPNEPSRDDDVRRGTVAVDALSLIEDDPEIAEHQHSDGSIMLSALSDDAESRLLDTFEEDWLSRLQELIESGCSAAEAVDYLMTEERGFSQTMWADRRGINQQSVSENVSEAKKELGIDDDE